MAGASANQWFSDGARTIAIVAICTTEQAAIGRTASGIVAYSRAFDSLFDIDAQLCNIQAHALIYSQNILLLHVN
mgnify:CR=1 FL=1